MPKFSLNASKKTKHTPAGEIPVDWACVKLGDVVNPIQSGASVSGDNQPPVENEIGVLKVSAVTSGVFIPNQSKRVTGSETKRLRNSVNANSILVNRANGSADLVGTAVLVYDHFENLFLPDKIWQITPITEKADLRFLGSIVTSRHFRRIVLNRASGGTGMMNIGSKSYLNIPIPLPPLPEQRKIAAILSTWDTALEKLDALIAAKTRRKQALMQQLLRRVASTEKLANVQHRFGDVVSRVTRKNTTGETNVLTISAKHGLVSQKDYFNRNVSGKDLSKYYLLKRGEFAYNRSSAIGYPYGALKRLEEYESGVLSTLYLCFNIKDVSETSAAYLCHYFESGLLNQGLQAIAKEGARAHGLLNVTASEFLDLDIFIPSFEQQKKIAAVLDTADAELRILQKQRATLEQQKRGLMQQLLTGKVRVIT